MRRPGGYATITGPRPTVEIDTFTCCHCNGVVFVKPKATVGGFCMQCNRNTCERPECNRGCVPFIKKVERAEQEQYRRDQNLKAMQ